VRPEPRPAASNLAHTRSSEPRLMARTAAFIRVFPIFPLPVFFRICCPQLRQSKGDDEMAACGQLGDTGLAAR
jgi:hypothetical protein